MQKICVIEVLQNSLKMMQKFSLAAVFYGNTGINYFQIMPLQGEIRYASFRNNDHSLSILFRGIGVEMIENIAKCPIIEDQKFKINGGLLQNLPSILCGHILNPKSQDRVLDMCAAPGNKTTHLSALMQNQVNQRVTSLIFVQLNIFFQGTLIALEKVKSKIEPLKEKLKTFHVDNVSVFQCDSTKIVTEEPNSIDVPPFSRNTFDKILLDAPCSGLGQRPQFYNKMSVKELRSYVPLQRKLFTNVSKFGGSEQ